MTVSDLLTAQLRLIGAVAPGETPEEPELADAMQANNLMLDSWSARRLMVRSLLQENFPLVAGQASYTIGTGGNFNTGRPISIPNAFLRNAGQDMPLDIVTEDVFNAQANKALSSGPPEMLFYDPGLTQQATPLGTIWLYNTPDQAYTLFIESLKYLTEFVNLDDEVTFEPAYLRAIKFNGALEYYYEYRKHTQPVPITVIRIAAESMRIIETMNTSLVVAGFDLPGSTKGRWNVLTDGYS